MNFLGRASRLRPIDVGNDGEQRKKHEGVVFQPERRAEQKSGGEVSKQRRGSIRGCDEEAEKDGDHQEAFGLRGIDVTVLRVPEGVHNDGDDRGADSEIALGEFEDAPRDCEHPEDIDEAAGHCT